MSDDLISRKAVLDILTEERVRSTILASPAFTEMLAQHIKKLPTAFDKEKVIEELLRKQHEALKMYNDKDTSCTAELKAFWHSRLEAYTLALEIVEKGGIENEEI